MRDKIVILLGIILSGVLGIIIYPTSVYGHRLPDAGFLAWFHLVPLLVVLYIQEKKRSRFLISFLTSFISFAGSLYWFAVAMTGFGGISLPTGTSVMLLIALILGFMFACVMTFSFWIFEKTRYPITLIIALTLTALDYLRVFFPVSGFPWPLPAYSQGSYLLFFQWMDVTGVWGLNILIYVINGLLAEMVWSWFGQHAVDRLLRRAVALVLLILVSFYASVLSQRGLQPAGPLAENVLSVGLIQGNIEQDVKWNSRKAHDYLQKYLKLSEQAADQGAELIIWPETAYPYTIDLLEKEKFTLDENNFFKSRYSILFGAVSSESQDDEEKIYNSAFLYSNQENGIQGVYHKRHLVPFGEYVPLKNLLKFAHKLTQSVGDFVVGDIREPMAFRNFHLGILICYEDIFPALARDEVKNGADWLVNISNDAWYGASSAIYQHLVFSQVRALENRRPLLRVTNTGITAIIDARGSVMKTLPAFTEGFLTQTIAFEKKNSLYTLLGDWLAWLSIFGVFMLFLKAIQKRNYEEEITHRAAH